MFPLDHLWWLDFKILLAFLGLFATLLLELWCLVTTPELLRMNGLCSRLACEQYSFLPQLQSCSHDSEGCRSYLLSHCLLFGFSSALEFLSALHDWLTRWLYAVDCMGADGEPRQMAVNVTASHLVALLLFHFLSSMWGMCLFKNRSVCVEVHHVGTCKVIQV